MKAELRSALLLLALVFLTSALPVHADSPVTNIVGGMDWGAGPYSIYQVGNVYSCSTDTVLRGFQMYLVPAYPSELRFFVYEATSLEGTYVRICETGCTSLGGNWYGAEMAVHLHAGQYYILGMSSPSLTRCYYNHGTPTPVAFGQRECGYFKSGYPPELETGNTSDPQAWYQKVTTSQVGRAICIGQPNGGQWYEPGNVISIQWTAGGWEWTGSDSIRLEYSADGGSTWNTIPGAESLSYGAGTFDWNTTGILSTQCRVRVVFNGDPSVNDGSDSNFSIGPDTTGPAIGSVGFPNTADLVGPYAICTKITDPLGVGDSTLYWRKNGGAFSSVPMTLSSPNTYCGAIPGPSVTGDSYCWYVEARDLSAAGNISRMPTSAPGTPGCFTVTRYSSTLGSSTNAYSGTGLSRGNVYACSLDCLLASIDQYINLTAQTELRFFVYESISQSGTYNKIAEKVVTAGPGQGWFSSGPMSVRLTYGRYYIMGVGCQGYSSLYYASSGQPIHVSPFGRSVSGYSSSTYPPPGTAAYSYAASVTYQRIGYYTQNIYGVQIGTISPPSVSFDPGSGISIRWSTSGNNWKPSDTVRIEYSNNGGSSWNQIPRAENLPYNVYIGSESGFYWNTNGMPEGTYQVRVVYNGNPSVNAVSPSFTLQRDFTPPAITHTPLTDTLELVGPYALSADISDVSSISRATIYLSKNGGSFNALQMTKVGGYNNSFTASIPGPSASGDRYCYYIEAVDKSSAANVSRSPAGAPGTVYCFSTLRCIQDVVGDASRNIAGAGMCRANTYACRPNDIALTSIEQYLDIPTPTELRFFVYEWRDYTYYKIHETIVPSSGTGPGWYGSGPIAVPLLRDGTYIIGAAWQGNVISYYRESGSSQNTAFGTAYLGFDMATYPPPETRKSSQSDGGSNRQYCQRLTTCRYVRAVGIKRPNGRELYDPGSIIPIQWTFPGSSWIAGDTVRLEYSSDGGSSWAGIPGAEAVAYSAGAFNWDTLGVTESEHYRVRAVCNADTYVVDGSDGDFSLRIDTTQPNVVHSPLPDVSDATGPYTVSAAVTDAYGVASVTLYWSRNDGPFSAVSMTPSGLTDGYGASIAGPSVPGDRYCYYIEARAASHAGNIGRCPSAAPSKLNCFMAMLSDTSILGGTAKSVWILNGMQGNFFACEAENLAISQTESYLLVDYAPTELRFVVYESSIATGPYVKTHETVIPNSGTGTKWYSSGPMLVRMTAGRYYFIGVAAKGSNTYGRCTETGHPVSTMFGHSFNGLSTSQIYPPTDTLSYWVNSQVYYQRIGTCSIATAISQGKKSPAGQEVDLTDQQVSAVFGDRFYAQRSDRSTGIGVLWAGDMPGMGDLVTLRGGMTTRNGERVIGGNSVQVTDHQSEPVPLAMTNLNTGGSDFHWAAGPPPVGQEGVADSTDLNNFGLLVTTFGRVTVAGSDFFYIDDGSHVEDHSIFVGLRVLCGGLSKPATGEFVAVTGISSVLKVGDGSFRSVRVRDQADIRVIAGM